MAPYGSLTIGLREQSDSGYTGIAYLAPGADGASTDVTVFLADTSDRNRGGDTAQAAAADDTAAAMDEDMAGDDSMATPDAMAGMDMGGESTPTP